MRVSIKRTVAVVFGAGTIVLSLLVGALTSAAAADEKMPTYEVGVAAPMVQPGSRLINRVVTDDMRADENDRPSSGDRFAIGSRQHKFHQSCEVIFSGFQPLQVQENNSDDTIVRDTWREKCGSRYTHVVGTKYRHLHLAYEDPDITLCQNGALSGTFAHVDNNQNCTAVDPLTEPRRSPYSHTDDEVIEFRMYDENGFQPFRLDWIRIVNQDVRLCAQKQPPTDTLVSNNNDGTTSTQCWILEPGYWNLASYTRNTKIVTMTAANGGGGPFSFDDMTIVNQ